MRSQWAYSLNRAIKKVDHLLYLDEVDHKLVVKRKGYKMVKYTVNGFNLYNQEPDDSIVLPLTHNWSMSGVRADWGIDRVLNKLRSIDSWNRDVLNEDILPFLARQEEAKKRERLNKAESFFSEYRDDFKKAWSDINTSTVKKIDNRRKYDKRIKE